jgi:serine protease Do
MKKRHVLAAVPLILIGLILGLAISVNFNTQQTTLAKERVITEEAKDFLSKLSKSLSEVTEVAKPSVVNISTTKTITMRSYPLDEFFNDPFFRRFFGENFNNFQHRRKYKSRALGSGVIVTEDGYILTNNHVVKDVDEINVKLNNGKEFKGKIVGSDPRSDLAVIKINAKNLPAIKIGDSDKLKVGEIVIAIGNPFGLNLTTTMGIVSAKGRSNVGIADYEDFIQTDAAINPGNSGGALVNIRGELVGINTAIFSTSGGYMGIGFAIPANMAKSVMQSIIKHGKVIRGWLGVTIQSLTPEVARHFDIKESTGALVTDVVKDSPAEKANLKRGDLIIELDGKAVKDSTALRNMVATITPGTEIKLKVVREGKEKVLTVTIGEFPEKVMARQGEYHNVLKGVHVQNLSPELRGNLGIPYKVQGVIITNVDEDSPAFNVLKRNDIIQEINRKAIKNIGDYENVVSRIGKQDSILLLIYRGGGYIYVTIRP